MLISRQTSASAAKRRKASRRQSPQNPDTIKEQTSVSLTEPKPQLNITDAGFMVLEVFDRDRKEELVSSISRLVNGQPEKGGQPVILGRTLPSPEVQNWKIPSNRIEPMFSEDAAQFNIKVGELVPAYQEVRMMLVDEPSVPFLVFLVRVKLEAARSDMEGLRSTVHRAAIPFRVFAERLKGLSGQVSSMSPRVPYVTWLKCLVDTDVLKSMADIVSRLSGASVLATSTQDQAKMMAELRAKLPLTLEDPAVPIVSYVLAFSNLHLVMGQTEQPAFGAFRTPFVVYLTDEKSLLDMPESMTVSFMPFFPSGAQLFFPPNAETIMLWLVALNLWVSRQIVLVSQLDQEARIVRSLLSGRSMTNAIAKAVSEVSLLGAKVAVAIGEVNSARRVSAGLLEQLTSGDVATFLEVPVRPLGRIDATVSARLGQFVGTLAPMARATSDALRFAEQHFGEIESEVSALQRHISDLATLQAGETSLKLSKRIERLTLALVILTGVLALLTIILTLK